MFGPPCLCPLKAISPAQPVHRHLAEVVTGQLQWALATHRGLGISGKRCKAVDLLEHTQVDPRCLDGLKATKVSIGSNDLPMWYTIRREEVMMNEQAMAHLEAKSPDAAIVECIQRDFNLAPFLAKMHFERMKGYLEEYLGLMARRLVLNLAPSPRLGGACGPATRRTATGAPMTLNQLPTLITLAIILLAIFELFPWLERHGMIGNILHSL
jgi:hypothetical protein